MKSPKRKLPIPSLDSIRQKGRQINAYLAEDVAADLFLEIELILLAFATGIMDATTFPAFHVFASNQTGNTVLLAVGTFGLGGSLVDLRLVAMSLGMFAAGGLVFGQIGNFIGCRSRRWLLTTSIFQTAMVFAASALEAHRIASQDGTLDLGTIALLGFASGAQVAMARNVSVPEVTTAMVTSAYIDLLADPDILAVKNRPRNRRFWFVVSLLLGSFVGAATYKYEKASLALYLSAACKALVCIAFFFNRKRESPGNSR
ncbi:hypothetical protein MMC20_006165 [Loxospora ochrophaea]|nr:hypothetical protein [Loxospora ochrophaea]